MSNFAGQIAIVAAGATAVVVAFGYLVGDGSSPAQAEAAPLPPAPIELGTMAQPAVETTPAEGITIDFSTSASLEGDGTMYGLFALKPLLHPSVDQVQLRIEPGNGLEITDVLGHNWESHGSAALIEVGRVSSMKRPEVLVEFRAIGNGDGELTTTATYRDDSGATGEQAADWRVSKGFKSGDILVKVREVYTDYALDRSAELADGANYDEALDLLSATRGANVELGLALRVVGELSDMQRQIAAREMEIREAAKPKPVVRKRARKKKTIDFVYGDQG